MAALVASSNNSIMSQVAPYSQFSDFSPVILTNIPSSYDEAVRFLSAYPHIAMTITEAAMPFLITDVNLAWSNICGFSEAELVGRSFRIIQGAHTDPVSTERLCQAALQGVPESALVYNYRKNGTVFANYVQIFPLYHPTAPNMITHYLGFFQEVPIMH